MVPSWCFFQSGLQGVGPLLAAGLRRRHQAVQEAVPQVGVTSSQVVSQMLHVHFVQLFVQQPVQHRVRHRLQQWFGHIQADVHTGPHGQITLVWYQWRRLALWLLLGRPFRLTQEFWDKAMVGDGFSHWVVWAAAWINHLQVWILLQEATVFKENCKVRVQVEDRWTPRDWEGYRTTRPHF